MLYVKNTIGCHHLSHFFMSNLTEANFLDNILYQSRQKTTKFKQFNRLTLCIYKCVEAISRAVPVFFFVLDVIKDLVFYFLLREQFKFINGDLESSDAEVNFSVGILTCIIASCAVTAIYCLINIQAMFPQEFWNWKFKLAFYCLLLLLSPFLPLLLQIQLIKENRKKDKLNSQQQKSNPQEYYYLTQTYEQNIKKMEKIHANVKIIEQATIEAIPQLIFLFCFLSFYNLSFISTAGRRYSYFYGIARALVQGNKVSHVVYYFTSLILSLFGAAISFVHHTNVYKHNCLNISRKCVLMLHYLLSMSARLVAMVSSLMLPVIIRSDFMANNIGVDFSKYLSQKHSQD